MKKFTYLTTLFLAMSLTFTGCRKEGTAEKVGEALDGTKGNSIRDAVNPDGLGEKAGKKLDNLGD